MASIYFLCVSGSPGVLPRTEPWEPSYEVGTQLSTSRKPRLRETFWGFFASGDVAASGLELQVRATEARPLSPEAEFQAWGSRAGAPRRRRQGWTGRSFSGSLACAGPARRGPSGLGRPPEHTRGSPQGAPGEGGRPLPPRPRTPAPRRRVCAPEPPALVCKPEGPGDSERTLGVGGRDPLRPGAGCSVQRASF